MHYYNVALPSRKTTTTYLSAFAVVLVLARERRVGEALEDVMDARRWVRQHRL